MHSRKPQEAEETGASAELAARLESIEGSAGGGADPRVAELMSRIDSMDRQLRESTPSEVPADIAERIAALEQGGGADGGGGQAYQPELLARMKDLERRLSQTEQSGGGGENVKALVEQETSRWSTWARQTRRPG